jgi:integral membrane sensor domain MASE1
LRETELNGSHRLASASAPVALGGHVERSEQPQMASVHAWPGVGALAAFVVAYMLAAAFGRWLMVIPGIPITIWPPNGVVLATLLTQPRQTWPWWIA